MAERGPSTQATESSREVDTVLTGPHRAGFCRAGQGRAGAMLSSLICTLLREEEPVMRLSNDTLWVFKQRLLPFPVSRLPTTQPYMLQMQKSESRLQV